MRKRKCLAHTGADYFQRSEGAIHRRSVYTSPRKVSSVESNNVPPQMFFPRRKVYQTVLCAKHQRLETARRDAFNEEIMKVSKNLRVGPKGKTTFALR